VLTSATGTTGCEFIHQHLLAPLGVGAEHWGRDPRGYFSGGYNFYVTQDLDLVVVMTTNTGDFSQDSFDGLSLIEEDVLPAIA
jgi:hypothetical protein